MQADQPTAWGPFAAQLGEHITLVPALLPITREFLDGEARVLLDEFFTRRKALQEALKGANGRLPTHLFAPLGFFVKWSGRGKTLELGWHLQHYRKGMRRKSIRLRKKDDTRYDLTLLTRHAKDYELALVLEIEERAECVRRRWKWIQKIADAQVYLAADPYRKDRGKAAWSAEPSRVDGVGTGSGRQGEMSTLRDGTPVRLPSDMSIAEWLAYRDNPTVDAPHPRDLRPFDPWEDE